LETTGGAGKKIDYRGLFLLCAGHMMTDMNTSALPAILPFLKEALGLSYAMAGTIVLFSNVTGSVIQPVFGYLADRRSLHWFLPAGLGSAALGMALLGWAGGYGQVLMLVIFSGLGVAIYHPEGWRIANYFAGDKKATGMSIFGVGGNLGFAFGPLLSVFFVKYFGLKGTSFLLLPGAAMAAIFLATRFWRVHPVVPAKGAAKEGGLPLRRIIYPMSLLLGMVIIRSWTHIGVMTFIPFYFINHMKGDPVQAGTFLFVFLAAGTLGTVVGGPLADRFGHKRIVLFSLGFTCPLLVFFLLSSGVLAYIFFTLAGFVLIFSFSVSMVMGQSFMPRNVGMASGLILGLAFGMGGVGAALLGAFADRFGVPLTLWLIAFLPLGAFACGALIPYPLKEE
jgi:MFS transporter, FSR family, fosmidomycin resistance protein